MLVFSYETWSPFVAGKLRVMDGATLSSSKPKAKDTSHPLQASAAPQAANSVSATVSGKKQSTAGVLHTLSFVSVLLAVSLSLWTKEVHIVGLFDTMRVLTRGVCATAQGRSRRGWSGCRGC